MSTIIIIIIIELFYLNFLVLLLVERWLQFCACFYRLSMEFCGLQFLKLNMKVAISSFIEKKLVDYFLFDKVRLLWIGISQLDTGVSSVCSISFNNKETENFSWLLV